MQQRNSRDPFADPLISHLHDKSGIVLSDCQGIIVQLDIGHDLVIFDLCMKGIFLVQLVFYMTDPVIVWVCFIDAVIEEDCHLEVGIVGGVLEETGLDVVSLLDESP